jgi:hypothetical protein
LRSLPISRSAVRAGRTLADLVTQVSRIVVLIATGLAVGWRIYHGFGGALLAAGLSLLFAFAATWAGLDGPAQPGGGASCPTPALTALRTASPFSQLPAASASACVQAAGIC